MRSGFFLLLGVLIFLALPGLGLAQSSEKSDTAAYIEAVNQAKDLSPEEQVVLWADFLEKHPESTYREEIETNLENLERLVQETDPQQKKEARDTQLYQRAVHFSKNLSPGDKILMWEQFLEENPDNLFRTEAEGILRALRAQYPNAAPQRRKKQETEEQSVVPVVPDLEFKDRDQAMILATFPGLLIPGMGHLYANDWTTFGLLAVFRAGAVGAVVPGILKSNRSLIIIGSVIYGFTYVVDVAHAPYAVDRYNEELEIQLKESKKPPVSRNPYLPPAPQALASITFHF